MYITEIIIRKEAFLLPSVHGYFCEKVREMVKAANLGGGEEESVTTQCILSNVVSLGNHLSYAVEYVGMAQCCIGLVETYLTPLLFRYNIVIRHRKHRVFHIKQ